MSEKELGDRVAIFGGSFNPPHLGHISVIRWILDEDLADQVWIVPCYMHPFEKKLESFEDRKRMCEIAFLQKNWPVAVLDIEKELGGMSYTVRTIEELLQIHTDKEFSLVVGSDIENEREKWRGFDTIEKLVDVIVIPRGGEDFNRSISSTSIREKISGGKTYSDLVPPEIEEYIKKHGLYS
ncbi:MAG: nicotinate-nicotinamide nucleotide adenylyltransferase [Pseudomonadota bacterium]